MGAYHQNSSSGLMACGRTAPLFRNGLWDIPPGGSCVSSARPKTLSAASKENCGRHPSCRGCCADAVLSLSSLTVALTAETSQFTPLPIFHCSYIKPWHLLCVPVLAPCSWCWLYILATHFLFGACPLSGSWCLPFSHNTPNSCASFITPAQTLPLGSCSHCGPR